MFFCRCAELARVLFFVSGRGRVSLSWNNKKVCRAIANPEFKGESFSPRAEQEEEEEEEEQEEQEEEEEEEQEEQQQEE